MSTRASRRATRAPILSSVRDSGRVRPRLRLSLIPVRFLAEGEESVGELKNISRAGVFVRTGELPRPGVQIALQFESPLGQVVDVRGEVRWSTRGLASGDLPEGFGVKIVEPPQAYREFFSWALAQVEKEDPEG